MNLRSKLTTANMPKVLSDLKHANQFLKVFALMALLMTCLTSAIGLALVGIFKGPMIVALSPSGERLSVDQKPKPELEIESAIRAYIKHRYTWDAKSVRENLKLAKAFVKLDALRAFEHGTGDVMKFAVDRNVIQRGYASAVKVDLANSTVKISGDRVTTISGLTAAGPLNLTLTFDSGPRTMDNPWGVYVTKERND